MRQRTNERELFHVLPDTRQMLTNLDSRDARGNRRELATRFDRRVGLHIETVKLRKAAG